MGIDSLRLVFIAVIPGIALAAALYLTDRYDREPLFLLIKVFLFGMVAALPTILVERILNELNFFSGLLGVAYTAFIVAGLTEEFFKRTVVLKFAYNNPAFNEKLDGIVYAAFAALGFATIENIMYVVTNFATNPFIWIYRGILSVPAHMLFAVTMGYYLSMAKFCPVASFRNYYYRRSLILPVILHGIFDFIIMAEIPFLLILFIPFVIYLWIFNLRKLNEYYHESRYRSYPS